MTIRSSTWTTFALFFRSFTALLLLSSCRANPFSKPYVVYRTNPHDQELDHRLEWPMDSQQHRSHVSPWTKHKSEKCPLRFSLGYSQRPHSSTGPAFAIRQATKIHPVYQSSNHHKQVIYVTQYEHLDLLTATENNSGDGNIRQALTQASSFPVLLESSSFHASPVIYDVNGDGSADAITVDYDGGITVVALGPHYYRHHTQIPRLFVRRNWVQDRLNDYYLDLNRTDKNEPDDPYHSYFEYAYHNAAATTTTTTDLIRGETKQDLDHDKLSAWQERSQRRTVINGEAQEEEGEAQAWNHRRLQEEQQQQQEPQVEDLSDGDPVTFQQQLKQEQHAEQKQQQQPKVEQQAAAGGVTEHRVERNEEESPPKQQKNPPEKKESVKVEADALEKQQEQQQQQKQPVDFVERVEADQVQAEEQPRVEQNEPPLHISREQEERFDSEQQVHEQQRRVDPLPDEDAEWDSQDELNMDGSSGVPHMDGTNPFDDAMYTRDDDAPPEKVQQRWKDRQADDLAGDDWGADDPEYGGRRYSEYDDYYGYDSSHEEYYDVKHYMRLPPHVLADPVLVELPKLYGKEGEVEAMLFVPVSYYFDEDEYDGFFSYQRFKEKDHGDETEAQRGTYVSSALMVYILGDSNRWNMQQHLDLSTDYTAPENVTLVGSIPVQADTSEMGAFALGSPTVADLDGDGSLEVIMGTSMGMLYAFDARQQLKRNRWPIQMPKGIQSRIVVEDVVGNTDLEVFVMDIGGTVACFSPNADVIWSRNIWESLGLQDEEEQELVASSPLAIGDVNGDGVLDLVTTVVVDKQGYVFAFNAATGEDLHHFPISLEKLPIDEDEVLHLKLPQGLLVDLHADQSHIQDYIRRNGTKWRAPKPKKRAGLPPLQGGDAPGLHIVQAFGEMLYIIEAGSGCVQPVAMGSDVIAMVQADDIHGTNTLDLVVATSEGKVLTLESSSPWHPLNTWTNGELRGRENGHAHGYSASQGIFVHDSSRQLRNILGVYVPITWEIFDNRPGISKEPGRRVYKVEVRAGTSANRVLWRKEYKETGVYTEKIYVRFGPGYYSLSVVMHTSHGLVFEDIIPVSYNIHFMEGFGTFLWFPLLLASTIIVLCGSRKASWDDEEADASRDDKRGILG